MYAPHFFTSTFYETPDILVLSAADGNDVWWQRHLFFLEGASENCFFRVFVFLPRKLVERNSNFVYIARRTALFQLKSFFVKEAKHSIIYHIISCIYIHICNKCFTIFCRREYCCQRNVSYVYMRWHLYEYEWVYTVPNPCILVSSCTAFTSYIIRARYRTIISILFYRESHGAVVGVFPSTAFVSAVGGGGGCVGVVWVLVLLQRQWAKHGM